MQERTGSFDDGVAESVRRFCFARWCADFEKNAAGAYDQRRLKCHDHDKNFSGKIRIESFTKSFILRVYDILARHSRRSAALAQLLAQVARLNRNVCQIKLPFKGFYNPPYLLTLSSIWREPQIGIELDQHGWKVTLTDIDLR
jgi:hypothetical protein